MNSVNLMGRLTKSPELKYTTNNIPVCGFTLAVDRDYTPEGQEKQADFLPCIVWQKKGEAAAKYLDKGRRVAVSGRLQTRNWDDNEGKKHYVTEIVVENWYFADDKKKDDNGAAPAPAAQAQKAASSQPAATPANPPPQGDAQAAFPWLGK
jgi:single-strand DNA-binding protein